MSFTESRTVFKMRCEAISPELFGCLEAHSLDSFSKMALAIGTPQVAPSQADVEAFVRRVIVDEEPAVALVSDVRELMFEASTYVLAELQKQVSAPAVEEAYRKIPLVPMLQSAKPSSSVSSRKETVKDTHAIQQPAESSRGLPDKLKGLKSKDEQGGPRC